MVWCQIMDNLRGGVIGVVEPFLSTRLPNYVDMEDCIWDCQILYLRYHIYLQGTYKRVSLFLLPLLNGFLIFHKNC
jgi:hypothetical protein